MGLILGVRTLNHSALANCKVLIFPHLVSVRSTVFSFFSPTKKTCSCLSFLCFHQLKHPNNMTLLPYIKVYKWCFPLSIHDIDTSVHFLLEDSRSTPSGSGQPTNTTQAQTTLIPAANSASPPTRTGTGDSAFSQACRPQTAHHLLHRPMAVRSLRWENSKERVLSYTNRKVW